MKREKTAAAVKAAGESWGKAPAHVRLMAAAYVGPLLAALEAINSELQALDNDLIAGVK